MNLAFGNNWNNEVASKLVQDFGQGNFTALPGIEILPSAAINGANGAFASLTNTVYLSEEFIAQNAGNPEAITSVVLEEIGHYIDSKINTLDAAGDEGDIFSRLVQGKTISADEIVGLKAEDDTATITLDGKSILIEQRGKKGDFNGDGISDLIRQEKGTWVDGVNDAQVLLANPNNANSWFWSFQSPITINNSHPLNGDYVNLITGDFNNDAKADFIRQEKGAWANGVNDVQIHLSNGNGTFSGGTPMNNMAAMNGNYVNLIVGDFNGDGTDDIVRQEKGTWVNGVNDVEFYTFSQGNFAKIGNVPNMSSLDGNYVNLLSGDFDGDGKADIIRQEKGAWVNGVNDAQVLLSNGNWTFKNPITINSPFSLDGNYVNLITGDFNGDRKTDFIRQEKDLWVDRINDAQIYISNGDGTFKAPVQINDMDAMNGNYVNLIVGDFTGGGADDIILQEKGSKVDGWNDVQFYTFSQGNFVRKGNVPDMGSLNGNFVNLAPGSLTSPLSGTVSVGNTQYTVDIRPYSKDGKLDYSGLDTNKDTVVVIHGRGDSSEGDNIKRLAMTAAATQYYPNSQVLSLDWRDAAIDNGQPPRTAAKNIRPVAQWAVNKLKELGIDPQRTILLGHSLGSYVASEMGGILGKVKELVALDPAYPASFNPYIGSYDIDGNTPNSQTPIKFSNAATKSTAFVASDSDYFGGIAGDNVQASTAHNSYIISFYGYGGSDKKADYHNAVVDVFSNLMSRNLSFPSLQQNWYDDYGVRLYRATNGYHEGIISANLSNGTRITGLEYVDSWGRKQTHPVWSGQFVSGSVGIDS
jgi:pimeloyl-ACP methyl ester carboxylesterase